MESYCGINHIERSRIVVSEKVARFIQVYTDMFGDVAHSKFYNEGGNGYIKEGIEIIFGNVNTWAEDESIDIFILKKHA